MPSEPCLDAACRALAAPWVEFCSLLAATVEEIRAGLPGRDAAGAPTGNGAGLGAFAMGRIDGERFARLLGPPRDVDAVTVAVLSRALAALSELEARGPDLQRVRVASGASLHDAVAAALTAIGRAFAAARSVARARAGRLTELDESAALEPLPFARWSPGERRLAPPLVVEVDGADCLAEGLAKFLDGSVRIALLVRGPAPPAPLARLVSPGTFVLQTEDVEQLTRLLHWNGPAVAAVVPAGCALFVHDPASASASATGSATGSASGPAPGLALRLTIDPLPEAPRAALGGLSAAQQAEQLAHLRALASLDAAAGSRPLSAVTAAIAAATPSTATTAAAPTCVTGATSATTGGPGAVATTSPDVVGRLAAWLLHTTNLEAP